MKKINLEMNRKLNILKNSIDKFNKRFENKGYKFYTSDEKTYVLKFSEESFLNLTNLNAAIRKNSKTNNTEQKLNRITKQILFNPNIKVKNKAFERSVVNAPYILSQLNFNIENVHSFVDLRFGKYILMKNKKNLVAVRIELEDEDEENMYYKIKSVSPTDILDGKHLMANILIDFPYKIEQIEYKDSQENKMSYSRLSKKAYDERFNMLREYAYFDSDDNDRKDDELFYVSELVKRVPIKE